jgi:hypothetical protein
MTQAETALAAATTTPARRLAGHARSPHCAAYPAATRKPADHDLVGGVPVQRVANRGKQLTSLDCRSRAALSESLAARRLRVDDVGSLPQCAGYPVPQPHLLKLLHQFGEQFAQRRQVKHSWFAARIHHPPSPCGAGRPARLVSNVADDGAGKARSISQADVVTVAVDAWAGRDTRGAIRRRVLRHQNHLSFGGPASALARPAGGTSTSFWVAILASMNSRGARELCSTDVAVMAASELRTSVSPVTDPPRLLRNARLLTSLDTPALHRCSWPGASPTMGEPRPPLPCSEDCWPSSGQPEPDRRSANTSTLALADRATCLLFPELDHPDQDVYQSGSGLGVGTKA